MLQRRAQSAEHPPGLHARLEAGADGFQAPGRAPRRWVAHPAVPGGQQTTRRHAPTDSTPRAQAFMSMIIDPTSSIRTRWPGPTSVVASSWMMIAGPTSSAKAPRRLRS